MKDEDRGTEEDSRSAQTPVFCLLSPVSCLLSPVSCLLPSAFYTTALTSA